jgi:hypothetical protein
MFQQTSPSPAFTVNVAVPEPSGSLDGTSTGPVSCVMSGRVGRRGESEG